MFSGIIETLGVVKNLEKDGSNLILEIESSESSQFYIDQSIAHNGVCLTVVSTTDTTHKVVAIDETLQKTNLNSLQTGAIVNLEKAITADKMLDGHIVQGHVDCTSICLDVEEKNGSWIFTFQLPSDYSHLLVDKGSITINGISLTVVNPLDDAFSVAIIPYTFEHTNIHKIKKGDAINLEFDILGKYISKYLSRMLNKNTLSKFIQANEN